MVGASDTLRLYYFYALQTLLVRTSRVNPSRLKGSRSSCAKEQRSSAFHKVIADVLDRVEHWVWQFLNHGQNSERNQCFKRTTSSIFILQRAGCRQLNTHTSPAVFETYDSSRLLLLLLRADSLSLGHRSSIGLHVFLRHRTASGNCSRRYSLAPVELRQFSRG